MLKKETQLFKRFFAFALLFAFCGKMRCLKIKTIDKNEIYFNGRGISNDCFCTATS
jgi:hypothetical protein